MPFKAGRNPLRQQGNEEDFSPEEPPHVLPHPLTSFAAKGQSCELHTSSGAAAPNPWQKPRGIGTGVMITATLTDVKAINKILFSPRQSHWCFSSVLTCCKRPQGLCFD